MTFIHRNFIVLKCTRQLYKQQKFQLNFLNLIFIVYIYTFLSLIKIIILLSCIYKYFYQLLNIKKNLKKPIAHTILSTTLYKTIYNTHIRHTDKETKGKQIVT